MHNAYLLKEKERASSFVGGQEKASEPVTQFGFHVPTCCGYLPQMNEWCNDWVVKCCFESSFVLLYTAGDYHLISL